ncbi:serine hydrolase [Lactococcus sp.]|uniref:serine hydrolase n=1 Tax=Lactococcus sp. TaxID=44273 RepID=UPI0035B18A7C
MKKRLVTGAFISLLLLSVNPVSADTSSSSSSSSSDNASLATSASSGTTEADGQSSQLEPAQTTTSSDDTATPAPPVESEVPQLTFTPLLEARYFKTKSAGQLIDLNSQTATTETYKANQEFFIVDKILINGTSYFRIASDQALDRAYAIPSSNLQELTFTSIGQKKWFAVKSATVKKYNLNSGQALTTTFTQGQQLRFVDQFTLKGQVYYRTEADAKAGLKRGLLRSDLTALTFTAMQGARFLQVNRSQIYKIDPATGNRVGAALTNGQEIKFTKKITVSGITYLQTQADAASGKQIGVAMQNLRELSEIGRLVQKIFNSNGNIIGAYYYDLQSGQTIGKAPSALTTSASTYKLFIARYVFYLMDTKQLSWNSAYPYASGNVRSGFYDMIHNSGNGFSEWILAKYGKQNVDRYLKSVGYKGISTQSGRATTSPDDLRKVLAYYYSHASNANVSYLLSLMKGQIYRSGIPQGTGKTVADKVGFLWDVRNDAGIVYGTHHYVLVVMTKNQYNFNLVNQVSRAVQTAVK